MSESDKILDSHLKGMKASVGEEKTIQFLRHFKGVISVIMDRIKDERKSNESKERPLS